MFFLCGQMVLFLFFCFVLSGNDTVVFIGAESKKGTVHT